METDCTARQQIVQTSSHHPNMASHDGLHALAVSLPIGGPQLLVLDSGVIYDDIVHRLRHPQKRGVLIGSSRRGTTRLFSPDHVFDEIYDRLDGHERRGVTREAVVACFEDLYLPHIRFVRLSASPMPARVVPVATVDPDDAPTASLALLLAPSLVFAVDRHLVDHGFGCAEDWLQLAWHADELLDYDGALVLTAIAWRGLGRRASATARWLTQDLRVSELAAGMMLGAALIVLAPQIVQRATITTERAGKGVAQLARGAAIAGARVLNERSRRATQLHTASVTADTPPGVANRLTRELALADGPLSSDDLAANVGQPSREIEQLLLNHSAFVHTGTGWQLGRWRAPRGR